MWSPPPVNSQQPARDAHIKVCFLRGILKYLSRGKLRGLFGLPAQGGQADPCGLKSAITGDQLACDETGFF